ncbi:SRPBCC family protein [Modestobacter versicolor]|uniref:SRPBCC family protein n=1 Tax=Modestobacter versicolor TaxID=429133 RepID=UPI0034DF3144
MSTKVEESIEVGVPVSTAYNQWTQFEDFPHFMGGVREVRQLDDQRLHWVAEIAGVRREWDATILEQVPDQKVAWAAVSGATNAGAVRFTPAGPGATTVSLTLEYEPEGVVEQVGDKLGVVGRQVRSDLERFKALIEDAGYESGAWRGSIQHGVGAGTPGVQDAALSQGDSGKAGMSAKSVIAGVAAVAAAGAAVAATRGGSESDAADVPPPAQPVEVPGEVPAEVPAEVPVAVVDQPPPDQVRDGVLLEASEAEGYDAPGTTEGVETAHRDDGDDPMIAGGSR